MAKERKIATEALVSIASGTGIECLSTEVADDRALLQESSEITFSNKDMEVGISDHRRPLYLAASINQISIKRALVDTGAFVNLIPLNTLQATRISEEKFKDAQWKWQGLAEGTNTPQAISNYG